MSRSRTPRRQFLRVLLLLVVFFAAALAGGFFYLKSRISPEKISAEASAILRRRLGLSLSVGEVRMTWNGNAELRRICVRNESMQSTRCLLSADIVQLDLRLLPLLHKQLEIRGAHLDNCELNLFSEVVETPEKKKAIRKSWEGTLPPLSETAPGGASSVAAPAVKMDNLSIRHAVIAHEERILPIPLGRTAVSLDLRDAGKRLALQAQLPDNSRIGAELKLKITDFLATARLLAAGPRLADTDQVSGVIECERCNLSAVDSRAGSLTGRLQVSAAAKEFTVSGEAVQVTTRNASAPSLVWQGNAALVLPDLYPTGGEGKLTAPGLSLQYRGLAGSARKGIEADFDAQADLARLPGNKALQGTAALHGQLRNRVLSASFSLHNFSTTMGGLSVAAAKLDGKLMDNRIHLTKQKVTLAGNFAEVTLDADTGSNPPSIQGSVAFRELNLDALTRQSRPAANSDARPAQAESAEPARVKVQIALSADALRLDKLKTGPLRAQVFSDGRMTDVKSWQVEFGQGRIQGSYQKQAGGTQNLAFRAAGVKAQNLNALLGFKATVYGTIDADARLGFTGSSLDSVLRTGSGQLSFRLGRGKIRDSFLQKGVLSGPLHKLEEKFADIEFASAQAEVRLSPNKIEIKKFFFDAEEWNITYRAESDAAWQGKAALAFRFRSSFVENVANPLHLGISDRRDGDFYDLPFACRGAVLTGDCYKKNW